MRSSTPTSDADTVQVIVSAFDRRHRPATDSRLRQSRSPCTGTCAMGCRPRRRGTPRGARHRSRPRHDLPVGANLHVRFHRHRPLSPARDRRQMVHRQDLRHDRRPLDLPIRRSINMASSWTSSSHNDATLMRRGHSSPAPSRMARRRPRSPPIELRSTRVVDDFVPAARHMTEQ